MRLTNFFKLSIMVVSVIILGCISASAQVSAGPKGTPINTELEQKANHDLEVAEFYIKGHKAYAAAIDRLNDILKEYPEFTHMDRVYFGMGESLQGLGRLAEKAGKKDDAAKQRAEAVKYYKRLLNEFPGGTLEPETKKHLKELGEDN